MQIQDEMKSFLAGIGLWEDERRKFVLPAGPHILSNRDVETINDLGLAIVAFMGVTDRMMHEAVDRNLGNNGMEFFRAAATAGIPKFRRKYQQQFPLSFPETMKVDLVRGLDGRLHVVEIDTTNTHGLGYGKILKSLEGFLEHDYRGFVGTESVLNHHPLSVIVPFHDRFHEGEWKSTARLINTLQSYSEGEIRCDDFRGKTILDIHHRLEKNFQEKLVAMVISGELKVIVPPKDRLESKNVLPLIWNEQTSKILLDCGLSREALKALRSYVPESLFTNRKTVWSEYSDREWLVKEAVSNGMKGVFRPSHIGSCPGDFKYILQRKIPQQVQEFKFFGNAGVEGAELFSRYVVYFNKNGSPLECLYTATDEELTHGGNGAIMGACSFA